MANPSPSAGGRSWIKWLLISAGVIAVVILAVNAASTFFQYKRAGEAWDAVNKSGGATSASDHGAASGDGRLDMYNTDITGQDYGRQLAVTLPYLQERRAQSMQEASDELDLQNRVNTLKPSELPADKTLRDAQIDQNNITADLWTISKETNSVLARNLLNAVFRNDPGNGNDGYDISAKNIGRGKRILEPTTVIEVSPLFDSGKLGGVDITGYPSYVALLASRTEGSEYAYEEVISTRTSQDGKLSNNVVVQTMQHDESAFIRSPARISPQR